MSYHAFSLDPRTVLGLAAVLPLTRLKRRTMRNRKSIIPMWEATNGRSAWL